MNPSPHVKVRPHSAMMIASLVVVNIIWWMVMLAAIGLGITHLSSCPVQLNIPIYLIVLGVTNLLSLSLTYTRGNWGNWGNDMISIMCSACMAILHLFTLIWLFIGTSWIYSVYPPDYTQGTARYCHKTTYQFAFAVTTLVWVATTLIFICSCCFGLLFCCKTVTAGHRLIPNRDSFYGAIRDSYEPAGGDV